MHPDTPPDRLSPQSLGEALRLLRNRARLRRDELAGLAGVSTGAVSNYENDVSAPSAVALRRVTNALAGMLGVAPAELWEQLGQIMDYAAASADTLRASEGERMT